METTKIITTLWAIAIPSTIVFIMLSFVQVQQTNKPKIISHSITIKNVLSFITFFSWVFILFLTLSKTINGSFALATILGIVLTTCINLIGNYTKKKRVRTLKNHYVKSFKNNKFKIVNKTRNSYIVE